MAAIVTDEDFRMAAGWWADANPGVFQGTRFIDATERKIYDERPQLVDVTPSQAVLEAALDLALAAVAEQQEIDAARVALSEIRQYLNRQLVKVTPDTPTEQVTTIKDIANGNTFLARIMTNQIAAMNAAFGWSLTNNPTTNATRLQYIVTVELLTGVLPQG